MRKSAVGCFVSVSVGGERRGRMGKVGVIDDIIMNNEAFIPNLPIFKIISQEKFKK